MKLLASALKDNMLSSHNPLRGLTMSRAVAELEAGQRGDYSLLQWLYHTIEKRDATLRGAKRRILASLMKLDWDIKIRAGIDEKLEGAAEKQQAALKESYNRIKGLRCAIKHQALAEFRGFCHIEKHFNAAGEVIGLEPVPQWHWCRDGVYGEWKFQENALQGGVTGEEIDPARFIIREVEDPIDEIALIAKVRKGLSEKDFDAFIARYGIPFVFWILSDVMAAALASDPEKMNEWMSIMRGIGSDGEGIIPGGTLETLDVSGGGGKDNNPFLQHLGWQDQQIVMAATSGKLTMLNEATGLGSGNAEAHQDTFDDIALALAKEISENFHEQFDVPELARLFPGQEPLVYFELAAKDSEDVGKLVSNVKTLADAGWEIDGEELSERTGYALTKKSDGQDPATTNDPNGNPNGDPQMQDDSDPEEDDDPWGDRETQIPAGDEAASMNRSAHGGSAAKSAKAAIRAQQPKSKRRKLLRGSSRVPTGSGMGFDPNQKRIPKGQANAGRWTDDGIISKGQRARRGVMRPATDADRKRLKIAPGFKDAKVTDDPNADLLATAVNAKGKPVSFYSEAYSKKQEAAKFARISALNKEMPALQSRISADAKSGNHQALTMRLITATGMRNGGDKGGGKVDTFGASNLRTDQVKVRGDVIDMDFIGKKGVRQRHSVTDALLAKHVQSRIDGGHETVFDGNSGKTLAYLKNISGDKFKVHDFRTWHATITADQTISVIQRKGQLPTNEAEFKSFQMRVAKVVSRRLGNDPAMALKAYIHPAVFNGY